MTLTPDYPQFEPTAVPGDGISVSAWRGNLKPFHNDAVVPSILADMEAERTLWISEGVIRPSASRSNHWASPLLTHMDMVCEVMLCVQPDAMPRAYLLSPRFKPWYADTRFHPHPRGDQTILFEGRPLPGLCVFSSAETTFDSNRNLYTQFLDQLTQYVAKHTIWLRTQRLCRTIGNSTVVLHQPRPGETILEQPPRFQTVVTPGGPCLAVDFWYGHWPGKPAKATTTDLHLRHIRSTQRCWCGLNKTYGECHRPLEVALIATSPQR